ncbi:MAG: hypothetical protein R3229_02980 [Alphaproteobacteria bacterium]|nr:hypothetical protein [Alphaproteobacteria bacterium]
MGSMYRGLVICVVVIASASAELRAGGLRPGPGIAVVTAGAAAGGGASQALERAKRVFMQRLRRGGARVSGHVMTPSKGAAGSADPLSVADQRWASPPVDAVLVLAVELQRRHGAYTARLSVALTATLHVIEAEAPPAIFRDRRERRLPSHCPDDCSSRIAARLASQGADALAPRLLRSINGLDLTPARALAFRGFDAPETREIQDYLRVFPGFRRMSQARQRGNAIVIRYLSRLSDRKLMAALRKMLGHMGIPAAVSKRGGTFTVARAAGHGGREGRRW